MVEDREGDEQVHTLWSHTMQMQREQCHGKQKEEMYCYVCLFEENIEESVRAAEKIEQEELDEDSEY